MKAAVLLLAVGIALTATMIAAPTAEARVCVVGYDSGCIVQIVCVMDCCTSYCEAPCECAYP